MRLAVFSSYFVVAVADVRTAAAALSRRAQLFVAKFVNIALLTLAQFANVSSLSFSTLGVTVFGGRYSGALALHSY
jgi:hypothetical protein